MIGDGELWFGAVCSDKGCGQRTIGIMAVNPP
jgi:hypothetical protein